jgi:hypothetical protein
MSIVEENWSKHTYTNVRARTLRDQAIGRIGTSECTRAVIIGGAGAESRCQAAPRYREAHGIDAIPLSQYNFRA